MCDCESVDINSIVDESKVYRADTIPKVTLAKWMYFVEWEQAK